MENVSLPNDLWNTTTEHDDHHEDDHEDDHDDKTHSHLAHIRVFALKVVYIIIGTVGVLDNMFVLIVFILFIKIANKVWISTLCHSVSQSINGSKKERMKKRKKARKKEINRERNKERKRERKKGSMKVEMKERVKK